MKAALYYKYGPPDVVRLEEVEKPVPKANEILVKIRAAAVTMGDCEMRSPKIPNFTWFLARLYFGLRKPRQKILGIIWQAKLNRLVLTLNYSKRVINFLGLALVLVLMPNIYAFQMSMLCHTCLLI